MVLCSGLLDPGIWASRYNSAVPRFPFQLFKSPPQPTFLTFERLFCSSFTRSIFLFITSGQLIRCGHRVSCLLLLIHLTPSPSLTHFGLVQQTQQTQQTIPFIPKILTSLLSQNHQDEVFHIGRVGLRQQHPCCAQQCLSQRPEAQSYSRGHHC